MTAIPPTLMDGLQVALHDHAGAWKVHAEAAKAVHPLQGAATMLLKRGEAVETAAHNPATRALMRLGATWDVVDSTRQDVHAAVTAIRDAARGADGTTNLGLHAELRQLDELVDAPVEPSALAPGWRRRVRDALTSGRDIPYASAVRVLDEAVDQAARGAGHGRLLPGANPVGRLVRQVAEAGPRLDARAVELRDLAGGIQLQFADAIEGTERLDFTARALEELRVASEETIARAARQRQAMLERFFAEQERALAGTGRHAIPIEAEPGRVPEQTATSVVVEAD